MKLYVQILDDNGEVVAEHEADACQPSQWRAPSSQKFIGKMPRNSDQDNTGTYELFCVTFQPIVKVMRPNGYEDRAKSPENGQPQYPWSMSAPTQQYQSPQISADSKRLI